MSFSKFEELEMSPEQSVGVAIRVIDLTSHAMHVGLLYAHSSGTVRFAHLAFHHDLRNDPAPTRQDYLWSVCMWLADPAMKETAKFMANYIEAIMTHAEEVDYGMNPSGVGFDASGQFYSLDPRRGLTCATFISAVFQSAGFPIVSLTTWPLRASDATWQDHVLKMLSSNGLEDRAKEIAEEEFAFRLTPAEAAAAASAVSVPLSYEAAVQLSEPLLRQLFLEISA
jgi:hypothetical protein